MCGDIRLDITVEERRWVGDGCYWALIVVSCQLLEAREVRVDSSYVDFHVGSAVAGLHTDQGVVFGDDEG